MSSYASQTVGTGFGAFGALVQGQNTANSLNYDAQVQQNNATTALTTAKFNADKQSLLATRQMGAATAAYGASGVSADSGSVMAVMGASAANAELDRQNILHGGDIRATNYENQVSIDQLGASNAIKSSYFNALSAMVAGGGKIAANNQTAGGGGGEAEGEDAASGEAVDMSGAGEGVSDMAAVGAW